MESPEVNVEQPAEPVVGRVDAPYVRPCRVEHGFSQGWPFAEMLSRVRDLGFQGTQGTPDGQEAAVERLVRHFYDGEQLRMSDVEILAAVLRMDRAQVTRDLPRSAAAFIAMDYFLRCKLERQLPERLPRVDLVRFMECASYDETPLRLRVWQDPAAAIDTSTSGAADSMARGLDVACAMCVR